MARHEAVARALSQGRTRLLEHEALDLARAYGIPVPEYGLARDQEEAVKVARSIGYPVVLKIVSPQVVHKSDVGGVLVGLSSDEEVREGFSRIVENVSRNVPGAEVVGVLVQKMAEKGGIEVIVGGIRDPVFGPTVMFGLGGVFVEVFRDVSFRVAPFTEDDAREMVREVKAYRILRGYRNIPPRDIDALVSVIMAVQRLMLENEEVSEVDVNPVLSYQQGALAVDVRVILSKRSATS
ncbi:MAG: acetate--CoA ligase family protein [Thermoproteota archaeon]